jgi:nicotinate-nucleotide pyrophosphorylase (carboxylating)
MSELPKGTIELIGLALSEDLGPGDVTSAATVPEASVATARILLKEPGVVCGLATVGEVFRQVGVDRVEPEVMEGVWIEEVPGEVAVITGPARAVLAGERVALNFLGHLSGIATLTARFVRELEGTGTRVLDTRKTTPGMRLLEKTAVAAGGGENHRTGLFDAILAKENHIALAGGIAATVAACRAEAPDLPIEVEAETVQQVGEAIEAGADRILLDNMDLEGLNESVALRDRAGGPDPTLEASGGITLENARVIAGTGVDFISVGALTHSAPNLDFSLLVEVDRG